MTNGGAIPRLLFYCFKTTHIVGGKMSNSLLAFLVFIGVVAVMISGIVTAIMDKTRTQHSTGFGSMTAFHDMESKEKQNAMETIIEKQTEKNWKEQGNDKMIK